MFSTTTEYAMRAMSWLALTPDTLVPTPLLAARARVPQHYLAKVLRQLADAHLVTGRRGVRGGYKLSRAASSISLLDVVRAVVRDERIERNHPDNRTRNPKGCPLQQTMDRAACLVIEVYGSATLASIIKNHKVQIHNGHAKSKSTAKAPRRTPKAKLAARR